MNCERAQRVLDAFLDAELDPTTQADVRRHVAGCATCQALLDRRVGLRSGLRLLPRYATPLPLREALQRRLDDEVHAAAPPTVVPDAPHRRAAAGFDEGAARMARVGRAAWWLGVGAVAGYALAVWVSAVAPAHRDLRDPLVAQHVASFDDGRPRVDVASADGHVVKPWFAGKLDFAPTVRDLSQQGFDLLGGRLDAVGGQPAAVLVYRVRRHHISLFVTRSPDTERPPASSTLRGFAVATWAHDGLAHMAVSDVDPRELLAFADLMASPAGRPKEGRPRSLRSLPFEGAGASLGRPGATDGPPAGGP